jgi:hypothetical protein
VNKLIFGIMPPQIEHPTLAKRVGIRPYMKNDMFHMMLEMEYIMSVIPTLEMYYLVHCFQICLRVGVTPPMLGAHITEDQFLTMWAIDDLEWKEYLAYNIVCCYIKNHQPRGYGALEFEVGCLRLYAL